MATLVVQPVAGDGHSTYFQSTDGSYANARAGALPADNGYGLGDGLVSAGQTFGGNYHVWETILGFDTSSLAGATITAAVLALAQETPNFGGHSATMRARVITPAATLTVADFVPGANLSGDTLVAHLASSSLVTDTLVNFVDDALAANINKTGITSIVICTDRVEAGTAPTGAEWADFWDNSNGPGTAPTLTITYTPAAGGGDTADPYGELGFFGL